MTNKVASPTSGEARNKPLQGEIPSAEVCYKCHFLFVT